MPDNIDAKAVETVSGIQATVNAGMHKKHVEELNTVLDSLEDLVGWCREYHYHQGPPVKASIGKDVRIAEGILRKYGRLK